MINFLKSITQKSRAETRTIILGHQKSGTTVIAKLLSRISDLRISIDPLYKVDHGKGKAAQALIKNPGSLETYSKNRPRLFHQPIIKDPDFTFIYPELKSYYNDAQFLFIIRDPRDIIRSICDRLGLTGKDLNEKYRIPAMKRETPHWKLILSGHLPQQGKIDSSSLNILQRLAHRWNLMAKIYMEYAHEMELIRYEDFIKDKEGIISGLADDLGLPGTKSITKYLNIQYQPKGNSDVDWSDFFGDENLADIEQICEEYMYVFGYEPIHILNNDNNEEVILDNQTISSDSDLAYERT